MKIDAINRCIDIVEGNSPFETTINARDELDALTDRIEELDMIISTMEENIKVIEDHNTELEAEAEAANKAWDAQQAEVERLRIDLAEAVGLIAKLYAKMCSACSPNQKLPRCPGECIESFDARAFVEAHKEATDAK